LSDAEPGPAVPGASNPDLDSNAAATDKDADPHGQPDVNAHEYVNGCTNEVADAGVSRRPAWPAGPGFLPRKNTA
jgi:hypothetical protein